MIAAGTGGQEPPAPLTPSGCDVRDYPYMPLDRRRLLTSETWADAAHDHALGVACVSLWLEAWDQVPAGSLPDRDHTLQRLANLEKPADWRRVRERALAGFIRCADGRLYHPVVAEKVLEAWIDKLRNRIKGGAGNAKRWGGSFDAAALQAELAHALALLTRLSPTHKLLARHKALDGGGTGGQGVAQGTGAPASPGKPRRARAPKAGGPAPLAEALDLRSPRDGANASIGDRTCDRSSDPPAIASKEKRSKPLYPLSRTDVDNSAGAGKVTDPAPPGGGAVAQGAPPGAPAPWYRTEAGIAAMGEGLGLPAPPEYADQENPGHAAAAARYRAEVFEAAGTGPWRALAAALRPTASSGTGGAGARRGTGGGASLAAAGSVGVR